MKTKLLLIFGLIPSILSQCSIERAKPDFQRAVYDFSIDMLTRLAQKKENHFVASTISSWTLLATISLGADDVTLSELRNVLQLNAYPCFDNKYLDIIREINSNTSSEVVVERSSIIFSDANIPVKETFKRSLVSKGVSEFQTVFFQDPDSAAQVINNYVNRATHETIEEIVTPEDLQDIVLVMIDAIFFKGSWTSPFSGPDTEVSAFYNERGVKTGDVNLMIQEYTYNYTVVDLIQAEVLELPYGSDGRYAALFMLPIKGTFLINVIENLKRVTLKTIYKIYEMKGNETVMVQIPRFKISSDLNNLKELLMDMGLKTMFDSSKARFPKLSDYNVSVSDFIQKADIVVTEEGTTASAVTQAGFAFRSSSPTFTANRPFIYMIVDKELQVPLFAGAYAKPSVY